MIPVGISLRRPSCECDGSSRERLPLSSDWFRSGVFHTDAVERSLRRDEQRLVVIFAESYVGRAFGDWDSCQQLAVGVEDVDAAVSCVKVALSIDCHAVAAFVDRE